MLIAHANFAQEPEKAQMQTHEMKKLTSRVIQLHPSFIYQTETNVLINYNCKLIFNQ